MVNDIPTIQPFTYQASTAFQERVQLADKLNEVIDTLNNLGDLPDLESKITELTTKVSELEESIGNTDTSLAELENQLNDLISEVNTTIKQGISALESEVDGIDARLKTAEGTISEHGTEIDGLLKEVIDGVIMTSNPHGTVQVQINHEDGSNDISAPIDLGLVEQGGIVLQSGTTDRSFKLIVTLTDGTSWQTNDFVIPEGGGTEVSVTNISIAQGTGANKIQVKIGLSDGSTISSNDWTVVTPTEFSALGTRVTTAEGKITKNTGDISDLETRVQAIEDSPGFTLQPATATTLGGVKIGAGITVQSDGTIAVDMTKINTAAVASALMFTADATKVRLHADSIAGSEFTKDIPQASQGGAGTIDAAAYQKLQSIPAPDTIATDAEISDLQEQITGLKLSNDTICVCSGKDNSVYGIVEVDPSLFASISPTSMYGRATSSNLGVNPTDGYLQINNIVLKTTQTLTLGLVPSPGSTVNGKINGKTKINLNLDATSVDCYYKFVSIKDGVVILDSPNPMWVKFYNVGVEYAPTKEGLTTDIIAKYEGTTITELTCLTDLYCNKVRSVAITFTAGSKIELSDTEITFD